MIEIHRRRLKVRTLSIARHSAGRGAADGTAARREA